MRNENEMALKIAENMNMAKYGNKIGEIYGSCRARK
jgi:hypothetical protein